MSSWIGIVALGALSLFVMLMPLWQRRSDRSLGTGIESNDLSVQWENEKNRLVKEQMDLDVSLAEGKITPEVHKVEREQVVQDAKHALDRLRLARSMSEKVASRIEQHKPKAYPKAGVGFAAGIFVATVALVYHLNGLDIQRQLTPQEAAKSVKQPDIAKMVASLEERVKAGGSSLKEQLMLARSYLVLGKRDQSIALYQSIHEKNEQDVSSVMALGEIHFNSKVPEEQEKALGFFDKALAIQPDKPEALWYKSLALLRDRKFDESRTLLVRLKDVSKDNKQAQEAVTQLLAELDKNRAKPQKKTPENN